MPQMRLRPGLRWRSLLYATPDPSIQYSLEIRFAKMKKKLSSCMSGKRLLWTCTKWEMRWKGLGTAAWSRILLLLLLMLQRDMGDAGLVFIHYHVTWFQM